MQHLSYCLHTASALERLAQAQKLLLSLEKFYSTGFAPSVACTVGCFSCLVMPDTPMIEHVDASWHARRLQNGVSHHCGSLHASLRAAGKRRPVNRLCCGVEYCGCLWVPCSCVRGRAVRTPLRAHTSNILLHNFHRVHCSFCVHGLGYILSCHSASLRCKVRALCRWQLLASPCSPFAL